MTRCLQVDGSWLMCCCSQMLPGTQALSASFVPSSLVHCHPLWHLMVLGWELDLSWHCSLCSLSAESDPFQPEGKSFPRSPTQLPDFCLHLTGENCITRPLPAGTWLGKGGQRGWISQPTAPDHLWDSQLGSLSGVRQMLGVTPEPTDSVSHAVSLLTCPAHLSAQTQALTHPLFV